MPSSNLARTLDRVWQLLELLPTDPPGLTPGQLWQLCEKEYRWGVVKRTVERYLNDLREVDLACTVEPPGARKQID